MKGAPWLVAGGTIVGLVAVLGYHTQAMPAAEVSGTGKVNAASSAKQSPASPSATAGTANKPKAGPSVQSGTATGPMVNYNYGTLDVKVTVQGGRITKVSVPTLRTLDPTSQGLSQDAIPVLTKEVLHAQSLKIYAVSGASYTSDAYARSLQAALDKLHFK